MSPLNPTFFPYNFYHFLPIDPHKNMSNHNQNMSDTTESSDSDIVPTKASKQAKKDKRQAKAKRATQQHVAPIQQPQRQPKAAPAPPANNKKNSIHLTAAEKASRLKKLSLLLVNVKRTKINLRHLNNKPCNTLLAKRHRAVVLLWNAGYKAKVIARIVGCGESTVGDIVRVVVARRQFEPIKPVRATVFTAQVFAAARQFFDANQSFLFTKFEAHMKANNITLARGRLYELLHMYNYTAKYPSKLAKLGSIFHRRNKVIRAQGVLNEWLNVDVVVAIDECSVNTTSLKREKYWSIRGEQAVANGPDNIRASCTCLMVCTPFGLHRFMASDKTFKKDIISKTLDKFFGEIAKDKRFKGKKVLVVMDNATVHSPDDLSNVFDNLPGWEVRWLPKYCPDANPAEFYIRAFKCYLRKLYRELPEDSPHYQSSIALRDWVVANGSKFCDEYKTGYKIFDHVQRLIKALIDCDGDVIAAKHLLRDEKRRNAQAARLAKIKSNPAEGESDEDGPYFDPSDSDWMTSDEDE